MEMNWITQPIQIEDDFDLDKILDSGQCFRPCRVQSGEYRFITGSQLLYLRPLGEGEYQAKCAPGEWERTWRPYFDLERSYGSLRRRWAGQAGFAQQALDYGQGIRVLQQDPWEMLITFILSQRKSIPAIRTGVELLAERSGRWWIQVQSVCRCFRPRHSWQRRQNPICGTAAWGIVPGISSTQPRPWPAVRWT